MNHALDYANTLTPLPGSKWVKMSNEERLNLVRKSLTNNSTEAVNILAITAAKQDGQVIVEFLEPIGPDQRGTILLDLEDYMKGTIDPGITVWLEPLGDRNSLRNLRGIEVKA